MYVKCLQFYISYFSGVEGTGTTVTHCECCRGRKAEAKGEEVWLQWEGNQTASPRCNWKILDSFKKIQKNNPWRCRLCRCIAAPHMGQGPGGLEPTIKHPVPRGWAEAAIPPRTPNRAGGNANGALGSPWEMLPLPPGPTPQHHLRGCVINCRGKWQILGCVPGEEGAARGAGTARGGHRAASPWEHVRLSCQQAGRDGCWQTAGKGCSTEGRSSGQTLLSGGL